MVHISAGKKEIIHLDHFKPHYYVVLDASKWGWGALLFGENKKFLLFANGQWARGDYGVPTKAEPLGVEAVVKRWSGIFANRKVAIITDHINLMYAHTALFVHSYYYNRCVETLQRQKQKSGTQFQIYFIKGRKNTADGVSRGESFVRDKVFPQVEGTGNCTASTYPWQT